MLATETILQDKHINIFKIYNSRIYTFMYNQGTGAQ